MLGFYSKALHIDLSSRQSYVEALDDKILRAGLGGKGLGSQLLLREAPPGIDPLSPANPLIIACGPLTATAMPGASRYGVYSKSPLTRGYAESYSGGSVAPVIKATGYDAIVIYGASEIPVSLHISDKGVNFLSAGHLWGKDTYETEASLLAEVGEGKAQAIVIGPAGENLVRFACIENNKWRSAGRAGLGAVMGSKRLKGIVFSGEAECPIADAVLLKETANRIIREGNASSSVLAYRQQGTPMMVKTNNETGSFPTRYWSEGTLEGWEKISAQQMRETMDVKPRACQRCFYACGKLTTVKVGRHAGLTIEGPEYETIYAFGGLCAIADLAEIAYLNDLCDRVGMDTISTGNLVAFAMEATRRGVLNGPYYGDADGAAELVERIGRKQGIGALLAEGIVRASRELGLEDIAIHVKGMEPAGYDPRVLKGMALAYATASRGACHLRSTFYKFEFSGVSDPDIIEGKAAMFVEVEDRLAIMDTLIMCRFYRDLLQWPELQTLIEAATGLRLSVEEMRRMANHIVTLTRAFNYREGFTRADDNLPARFHDEPIDGKIISRPELEKMLSEYYALRGWDAGGKPSLDFQTKQRQ